MRPASTLDHKRPERERRDMPVTVTRRTPKLVFFRMTRRGEGLYWQEVAEESASCWRDCDEALCVVVAGRCAGQCGMSSAASGARGGAAGEARSADTDYLQGIGPLRGPARDEGAGCHPGREGETQGHGISSRLLGAHRAGSPQP